jgi:uncharacterized GH25 family protein
MAYLAESALLDETAEMVLKPGILVAGTVVDDSGNPVAGAKVTEDRDWNNSLATQETGLDGRFRFGNGSGQPTVLTVQADGFAPRDMTVQPGAETARLTFGLSKGAPLVVQVTSAIGKPLANARIRFSADDHNRERFAWRGTTDSDGRLEWPSAPPSVESYSVSASGYKSQENLKWSPDGSDHLVRLHKSDNATPQTVKISGTVVDADNRQPIDAFTVSTQYSIPSANSVQPSGLSFRESRTTGTAGAFSINLEDTVTGSVMEIQADGYWPVRLTNGVSTTDTHLDVALKRGTGLAGTVQLPDGTPVARATVILCAMGSAYMRLPGEFEPNGSENMLTDSEGRFAFQPRLGVREILVSDKGGYAEITVEQFSPSNAIVLQPWGRVEGMLKIGRRPGARETVLLSSYSLRGAFPSENRPAVTMETKADADGHFVIEGVLPGEREMSHVLNLTNFTGPMPRMSPLSQRTLINIAPGQTTEVAIGGQGRRVVGRIWVDNPGLTIDWRRDVQSLTSKIAGAPPDLRFDGDDATRKRWSEFWRSPTGREAQLLQRKYVPVFEANGFFGVDDVLPGDYELNISISDPAEPNDAPYILRNILNRKYLGSLHTNITVTAADDAEAPFDLGALQLELEHK